MSKTLVAQGRDITSRRQGSPVRMHWLEEGIEVTEIPENETSRWLMASPNVIASGWQAGSGLRSRCEAA